jgi:hypothetical protein
MEDLEEDQGNRIICYRLALLFVLLPMSGGLVPEEAGIKSIGVSLNERIEYPVLIFCRREKMYSFFMSLKQPDGSFVVTSHAEVDVRCGFHAFIPIQCFILYIYSQRNILSTRNRSSFEPAHTGTCGRDGGVHCFVPNL